MTRVAVLLFSACVSAALAIAALAWFERREQVAGAAPQLTADPLNLPTLGVALVLGTGPVTYWRDGRITPNVPFVYRLDAAAALWRAGKVKYLIASGNRTGNYDEPTAMRAGLIARGVPSDVIYRDFAGYRTIDSVLRARSVFGVRRMVIVSQRAHIERAMFLARAAGIDAWGLAARDENGHRSGLKDAPFLDATALVAWWDVLVGTAARRNDPPIRLGFDPAD